ncbi:hypothetical protein QBC39DRAFT_295065 [Podospora conica]|nr:hypothetical protein QBC39DRAFT_295065 [Schizothecium conicum]
MSLHLRLIAVFPRCCPNPTAAAAARRVTASVQFVPKRGFMSTTGAGPRRWEALWSSSSRTKMGSARVSRFVFDAVKGRRGMASESARAGDGSKPGFVPRKSGFPERLLIYHPGTARITFLVAVKVMTIFSFSFFSLVAVPAYLHTGESHQMTAAIFLCGLIPLVFVAYSTAPFVTSVHLQLPHFARSSTELLRRFAANPPPNTRLEVGTLSFFGTPRLTTLTVADLRPMSERWGMVNFARDNALAARRARRWWHLPVVTKFNFQEGYADFVKGGWVWKELEAGIRRRVAAGGM